MEQKIECPWCGVMKARLINWKDRQMCSTCVTLASAINNHPDVLAKLYTDIHGVELVDGGVCETTPEVDYLHGVVFEINKALGGGYLVGDIPGAVKALAERAAVMTTAVQVSEEHGAGCDPHNCEELRAAMAVVMDVAEVLHGVCAEPEKPGQLAAAVQTLIVDRDCLRMDNARLRAELESLQVDYSGASAELAAPDPDRYVVPDGYESLMGVFVNAMHQAANGKGLKRHATPVPFERQSSCCIARDVGIAFPLGQAIKKAKECQRLPGEHALFEILGALVYLAMAYIVRSEELR